MENKVRLITPFLMLLAGAIASIIMYIREYDFEKMLWVLLIVLLVFYVIGDIVRYLYASVRPRIIPSENISNVVIGSFNDGSNGSVVAFSEAENGFGSETVSEEYSEEALAEYDDEDTEENENKTGDNGYESGEYEEEHISTT